MQTRNRTRWIQRALLIGVAVVVGAPAASAEDNPAKEAGEELGLRQGGGAYGSAGCGLGSLVFSPDTGFTQVFAATTNSTFYSQTFGITTGTSNCDDGDGGSASARNFVSANRTQLAKEIARGGGESVAALGQIAGCRDNKAVGRALQRNFKTIFPNSKASNKAVGDRVVSVLSADSLSCTKL